MTVYRKHITVTASSTQTVSMGRIYTNASFWRLSGTGSGAVKVAIQGAGGRASYIKPSPNRVGLLADDPPQKFVDVTFDGLKLWCSGTTAATVIMLVNAWEHPN